MVTNALPDTDPILSVLTQLRSLAGINGVTISGISLGASDVGASGLNESNISFNVLGPMNQIVSFLTGTQLVSPIIVLNKVDVVQRDSIFEASVTAKSFWSPSLQLFSSNRGCNGFN